MAINITMIAPGFVGNTFYNTGATADVSEADAVAAVSSQVARYTTQPLLSQAASTEALLSSFEGLSSSKKAEFRDALDITAGGGSGDMVSAAPVVTGSMVTTAHAMPANEIDTTKILETKTISGATTFTISATPAANTRGLIRLTNSSGSAVVLTLPGSPAWYSEALGQDVATVTIPGNWVGELSWVYDGTKFRLKGDPVTVSQAWVAQTVATNVISASEIDWSKGPSHSKTLSANTTFTFANALDGQTINVAVTNTAGNYTVAWPALQWSGGSAPTQTVGAKTDIYTFTKVGANIYGNVSANHS